ncbi:hypothetical protein DFH06DRAFT_1363201 [Mycena polygramma]|nr:hypothetical protein DFH06DRAFT_1363201 [Mycena polygramma]
MSGTLPTASERAALASDRGLILDIETQILKLEASLIALKQQKKSAEDRLDAYIYPVLTLPNEIASEIFVHVLPAHLEYPAPIGPLSPYLLCHICQKWRDIAFTTPGLWSAISLPMSKTMSFLPLRSTVSFQQQLRLLKTWLKRSGSCLLSIELKGAAVESSQLAPFGRAIKKHCARLEHLALSVPQPLDVFRIPRGEVPLPHLRTLKLGCDRANLTATPSFLAASLLRKVSIHTYLDVYGAILPWSQLTVFSVHWITANQAAGVLTQLVNIVSCRLRVDHTEDLDANWPGVTLPHMETLILESSRAWIRRSLFHALTLPALRRLHISRGFIGNVRNLVAFVARSGCSVEELCVPGAGPSQGYYRVVVPTATTYVFDLHGRLTVTEPFLMEPDSDEESSTDLESGDDTD